MKRRWLYLSGVLLIVMMIGSFLTVGLSRSIKRPQQVGRAAKPVADSQEPLTVTIVPWGPTQEMLDDTIKTVLRNSKLQGLLRGTRYRQLSYGYIDQDDKSNPNPAPPSRFQVTFYDYTNNRTIFAEGAFDNPRLLDVTTSNEQPNPSNEEFDAAVQVLKKDPQLGPALRDGSVKAYPPMPPVIYPVKGNRLVERTITVGLIPYASNKQPHEIVAVNMIHNTVMRFPGGAPPTALATPTATCGISSAGQSTTSNGTVGQYQITVSQSGNTLWDFMAIRPSASSGNSGERSGIEIQNVKYKGKMVMKRGHVPILNVKYDGDACGPYRDWQYQEGMFQTDATNCTDVGAGFRQCTTPATTALETSNDTGNFKGVAVYTQGTETVLVTEMNAGWYRYIHEWRFDSDGTIRPRYGFGATTSSCVCSVHHHHVYWRFDFDIVTPEKNAVYENSLEGGFWQPNAISTEARLYRNQPFQQSWLVKNISSGEGYRIIPGRDGTAFNDPFAYGKGDLWVLQYHSSGGVPTELDDPNTNTSANIDAWLTNESVNNQDVVIWYGAHFDHTDGSNIMNVKDTNILTGDHVVGPDLVPSNW